jgi:hypothetical protein
MSEVPRQSTMPVQRATTMLTIGDSGDLICRALSAASMVARGLQMLNLEILAAERLDRVHRSQPFLDHRDDFALAGAHDTRDIFYRPLELNDKHQKEGRDPEGDQRKIPVHPEHQPHHKYDGDHVHEDAERRR